MNDQPQSLSGANATSFDALVLQADFEALPRGDDRDPSDRWAAVLVAALEVHVTMSPAAHPTENFVARLVWSRYPDAAPSVTFIDPATGRSDIPQAWPTGGPFRPVMGLCCNYTAEGFGLHQEWIKDPRFRWRADGNVLLKVIRLLQEDLDNHYAGRHR